MKEHLPSHLSKWDCTSTSYQPQICMLSWRLHILKKNSFELQYTFEENTIRPALLITVPRILVISVSLLIELQWYTHSLTWVDMALKTSFNFTLVNALDLHELPLLLFEKEIKVLVGISLNLLQKIWYMMLVFQHWLDVFSTMHPNKQ